MHCVQAMQPSNVTVIARYISGVVYFEVYCVVKWSEASAVRGGGLGPSVESLIRRHPISESNAAAAAAAVGSRTRSLASLTVRSSARRPACSCSAPADCALMKLRHPASVRTADETVDTRDDVGLPTAVCLSRRTVKTIRIYLRIFWVRARFIIPSTYSDTDVRNRFCYRKLAAKYPWIYGYFYSAAADPRRPAVASHCVDYIAWSVIWRRRMFRRS